MKSLVLRVPGWPGHRRGPARRRAAHRRGRLPGAAQLLDRVRAGVPRCHAHRRAHRGRRGLALSAREVRRGDRFELRGPIGGYFVWTAATGGPLFLIAGGSGIAPLMAMLRHRAAVQSRVPAVLLYSSRTFEDIIYREELERLAGARRRAHGRAHAHARAARRLDRPGAPDRPRHAGERRLRRRRCGRRSSSADRRALVESAARPLLELGHEPESRSGRSGSDRQEVDCDERGARSCRRSTAMPPPDC